MSDKEAITTTDSPALRTAREQHALALADDPTKLGWTGLNLGRLLQLARDREGARDAFQHAIDSADPDNAPVAAIGLGRLLAETGDAPGAADAYWIAARSGHKKQAPAAAYALGEVLREQGDSEGARSAFQEAADSGNPWFGRLAETALVDLG